MTLVAIGSTLYLPSYPPGYLTQNIGVATYPTVNLLDAATEKLAMSFTVPKDGTLAKAGFLLGTVTQAPVNGLRASFQDFDLTTGDPDGTQDQYRDVTSGLTSGAWITTGLITSTGADGGVKRSVQAGQHLFLVIEYTSFSASDSLNIGAMGSASSGLFLESAFTDHFTAAWVKSVSRNPVLYLEYDDGSTFEFAGCLPVSAMVTSTITTATTPDEIAAKITLPFKSRVIGMWASVTQANNGSYDLVLYDSGGAVLGSQSWDQDEGLESGTYCGAVAMFDPVTVAAAATVYATVKPTTANNVLVGGFDVSAAGIMGAFSMGANCIWSQRTDAGAWSETTTRRPMIGLFIDQLDDGAGGAGGGLARIIGG